MGTYEVTLYPFKIRRDYRDCLQERTSNGLRTWYSASCIGQMTSPSSSPSSKSAFQNLLQGKRLVPANDGATKHAERSLLMGSRRTSSLLYLVEGDRKLVESQLGTQFSSV